jgi:hypothetical protein
MLGILVHKSKFESPHVHRYLALNPAADSHLRLTGGSIRCLDKIFSMAEICQSKVSFLSGLRGRWSRLYIYYFSLLTKLCTWIQFIQSYQKPEAQVIAPSSRKLKASLKSISSITTAVSFL